MKKKNENISILIDGYPHLEYCFICVSSPQEKKVPRVKYFILCKCSHMTRKKKSWIVYLQQETKQKHNTSKCYVIAKVG